MNEIHPTTRSSRTGLPDPREWSDSSTESRPDIVVYDGQCKFCTASVKQLFRLDGKRRLAFVSLHDKWVQSILPDVSHEQLMEQMYIVSARGDSYAGAAAFRYLTRKLPKLWLLMPLMHIPFSLPLWQWCYRQVVKRRYRFGKIDDPCDDGTCSVHFDD